MFLVKVCRSFCLPWCYYGVVTRRLEFCQSLTMVHFAWLVFYSSNQWGELDFMEHFDSFLILMPAKINILNVVYQFNKNEHLY